MSLLYQKLQVIITKYHLKQKNLILLLSVIIGILSGLAAVFLKHAVHFVENLVAGVSRVEEQNILYLVLPMLGIFLTSIFLHLFVKEDISHGVSKILQAISKKNGRIKKHNTYSSMIGCSLTVGFGGSVGMEAPILFTGAAIGSNIGMFFKQNYRLRVILIAAGVSGAMAAIFKAPIAGIIFAVEVLMLEMSAYAIMPVIISSVTGAIVSTILLGKKLEFYFAISDTFNINNIHLFALLGVFCGIISLYFLFINEQIEQKLSNILSPIKRILIGGLFLGLLIFLFPPLFGEGYKSMKLILSGEVHQLTNNSFFYNYQENSWIFLLYLLLILLLKVFATSLTTGSGGIGGVFAPSLFMGGIAGAFFAKLVNKLSFVNVSESNFTLIGMAGIIAGIVHAPLTAIFLIAEITGGYELFIPLILTSSISYLTVNIFRPHSIYTKKLAQKGELITHDKDKAVLTLLSVREMIETNFSSLKPEDTLNEVVNKIAESKRNIFPVVGKDNEFIGVVGLDDVRTIMFNKDLYHKITVKELMNIPPEVVYISDNMDLMMQKFQKTGLWNLPVIENKKYIGFVSRSNVFNFYREKLREFSDQ